MRFKLSEDGSKTTLIDGDSEIIVSTEKILKEGIYTSIFSKEVSEGVRIKSPLKGSSKIRIFTEDKEVSTNVQEYTHIISSIKAQLKYK